MNGLNLHNLHKTFDKTPALRGVSFHIQEGEIVAVLGPSGCGKSTLLGIIAGLTQPDQGQISWEGKDLASIPPHQRGFGLMFQDFALFPHRNVRENVAFGLQMAHWPAEKISSRVTEVLELVGLPGFQPRDVNTLSGGESQRVALARSLAPHPNLLMLDEPLGSLDRNLRERLTADLRSILQKSAQTALYVTHDQEEAFVIADRVVIMNAGRVEQVGVPQELYYQPACSFVARFLGLDNLLPGEIRLAETGFVVHTVLGTFPAPQAKQAGPATVLLRPDAAQLDASDHDNSTWSFSGKLTLASFRGSTCRVQVESHGGAFKFEITSRHALPPIGENISLFLDLEHAVQILPQAECGKSS